MELVDDRRWTRGGAGVGGTRRTLTFLAVGVCLEGMTGLGLMGMVCSIGDTAADDGVEGPACWSDGPRGKVPYSVRGSLTGSDEVSRSVWRSWS